MALSVFEALRFSAMTCVTPFMDIKGVVLPPCLLTSPFKCILCEFTAQKIKHARREQSQQQLCGLSGGRTRTSALVIFRAANMYNCRLYKPYGRVSPKTFQGFCEVSETVWATSSPP